MFHVVIRERRHRVVAVVVVRLVADLQTLDARLLGRLLEVLGQKLALLVEVVAGAHVNEHIQRSLPLLHELRCVVLLPLLLLVLAEVAAKGLLAPWAVDGVGDGCKGGDGLVLAGVAEELSGINICA